MSTLLDGKYTDVFSNAELIIVRLAPQDYHRFHAPLDGNITDIYNIQGSFNTVNDDGVRSENQVLQVNQRMVVIMETSVRSSE